MGNISALKTARTLETDEWQLRVDLAAAFRLAAMYDWHEAVANHLSLAVSADGKKFLMNPRWRHFSQIRASELLLLDSNDASTMDRPDAPDLHGPQARHDLARYDRHLDVDAGVLRDGVTRSQPRPDFPLALAAVEHSRRSISVVLSQEVESQS